MLKQLIRSASSTTKRGSKFGKDESTYKRTTVDRYLPQTQRKPQKEWEKRGVTKDEFFIKKYSFMSDDQKKRLQQKTDRQERYKQHRRDHEQQKDSRDGRDRDGRDQKSSWPTRDQRGGMSTREQRDQEYRPRRDYRDDRNVGEDRDNRDSMRVARDRSTRDYNRSTGNYNRSRDYRDNSRTSRDRYRDEDEGPDRSLYEMLFGRHAILSALKTKKRQSFDKLYYTTGRTPISDILSMCTKLGIKTEEAFSRQKLDQLTNNAVHNGVVLQTRKLELPTLASLGKADEKTCTYEVTLWNELFNSQIKTSKSVIRPATSEGKYPLGLYLDEITDPQNVGAIIRTSFFLGVDFIITPSHNSARLGPVTAKAAAGALDLMDIYQVENGLKFIRAMKESDWSIITTDSNSANAIEQTQLPSILSHSPVLLVLGSEGAGVRTNIKNLSDHFVAVPKNRKVPDHIVDSINVSAAASVLISKLLE